MQRALVLPFLLACTVVSAALWTLDHYAERLSQPFFPRDPAQSRPDPASPVNETANKSTVDSPAAVTAPPTERHARIEKCIRNGRPLYSDVDCAGHADALTVPLHDSAGVVSPNKALLSQLETQRQLRERTGEGTSKTGAIIGGGPASECTDLNRQINDYDDLARQPYSADMQDWIRERRKAVRERQFAHRCP